MSGIVKKGFTSPDEVQNPKKEMRIEIVEIAGSKFRRHTAAPGYHGHDCPVDHLLYVVSGRLHARMPDGEAVEFRSGDLAAIPPGHEAWNGGNEAVVWLEIPRPEDGRTT